MSTALCMWNIELLTVSQRLTDVGVDSTVSTWQSLDALSWCEQMFGRIPTLSSGAAIFRIVSQSVLYWLLYCFINKTIFICEFTESFIELLYIYMFLLSVLIVYTKRYDSVYWSMSIDSRLKSCVQSLKAGAKRLSWGMHVSFHPFIHRVRVRTVQYSQCIYSTVEKGSLYCTLYGISFSICALHSTVRYCSTLVLQSKCRQKCHSNIRDH